jgi:hypothetical protein
MPNAELMNSISNFMMGFFNLSCLIYLIRTKKNSVGIQPKLLFVIFIAMSFTGMIAHIPSLSLFELAISWSFISLEVLGFVFLVWFSHDISKKIAIVGAFISLVLIFYHIIAYFNLVFLGHKEPSFLLLALPMLTAMIALAYKSYGYVRIGAITKIFANVFQVFGTYTVLQLVGQDRYDDFKYHNDIYHLLLMISSFYFCKGVLKGQWIGFNKIKNVLS